MYNSSAEVKTKMEGILWINQTKCSLLSDLSEQLPLFSRSDVWFVPVSEY